MAKYIISPRTLILILMWATGVQANSVKQTPMVNQGYIRVGMKGSIIDTPCNISGPDESQLIEIGVEPVGDIIHNGWGMQREFSIHLINCTIKSSTPWLPDASSFQITFDGERDGSLFNVSGGASGVGLEIIDAEGRIAEPGKPLPTTQLLSGNMRLDYTLRLVGDKHRLKVGRYHSTIRFKIEYH